jgi:voltage-gated potassium channel
MKLTRQIKVLLVSLAAAPVLGGLLLWSEGALTSREAAWEALENAVIALMGEYPDKPSTVAGRIVQLLLLIFGTFIFGAIVGKISSIFVTRALVQKIAMTSFRNHIILCNWNNKATAIVRQLLEANQEEPRDIVVISASEIPNREDFETEDRVYFIQADPTHHAALEQLQATQAKAVILLADEGSESPDEKNALIALAVKHLEQDPSLRKDIHVIGELVNLDRRRHLQEAGVDEVIAACDYSSGIIAQSAVFKNMSAVYQQLLTYSDDSNEFYFIEPGRYPSSFWGKTFIELSHLVSQCGRQQQDNPLLLIGVRRRNGEILLNPRSYDFDVLTQDDALIVMAFHPTSRINSP